MSPRARALVLISTLALTTACAKPKPVTVTPKSAQVLSLSPRGVELAVAFDVTNPNRFPLIVHSVDGHFALGPGTGTELGTAHAEPSASIPAQATSTVTSTVAVGWTNLAALAPFALSPGAVPYTFAGNAAMGGSELNVTVPFTLTGELTREQLISVGLAGLGR
jgi:LEA14-like dessication related protein